MDPAQPGATGHPTQGATPHPEISAGGAGADPQRTPPGPRRRWRLGPGMIITASFVGPGTITTATVTGSSYGFALLWTVVFSIVATVVLQEMSARLGVVTREGLGEALRTTFAHPVARSALLLLVIAAIGIGGASYAGGDTTGTALGLATLTGLPQPVVVALTGLVVLALLATGSYRTLEALLGLLVVLMSAVFVLTAVLASPDWSALLTGLVVPTIPAGALLSAVALIGTTVVPYNLFLHANLVQEKWSADEPTAAALTEARRDTTVSIAIGGLITVAIMATAAGTLFTEGITAESSAAMAGQLEPVLGPAAPYVFALGLAAAGLTSAIAGPLGAAYAIASTAGWSTSLKSRRFQAIWAVVVVIGVAIALTGIEPVAIIVTAQAANGLLLPVVAVALLIVMNRRGLLGAYRNGVAANVLGALVVTVVIGLGAYQLADLAGLLPS